MEQEIDKGDDLMTTVGVVVTALTPRLFNPFNADLKSIYITVCPRIFVFALSDVKWNQGLPVPVAIPLSPVQLITPDYLSRVYAELLVVGS